MNDDVSILCLSVSLDKFPSCFIFRHNLMQVAQILQVLVVSKREDIDPKVGDLYSKFQVSSTTDVKNLLFLRLLDIYPFQF